MGSGLQPGRSQPLPGVHRGQKADGNALGFPCSGLFAVSVRNDVSGSKRERFLSSRRLPAGRPSLSGGSLGFFSLRASDTQLVSPLPVPTSSVPVTEIRDSSWHRQAGDTCCWGMLSGHRASLWYLEKDPPASDLCLLLRLSTKEQGKERLEETVLRKPWKPSVSAPGCARAVGMGSDGMT